MRRGRSRWSAVALGLGLSLSPGPQAAQADPALLKAALTLYAGGQVSALVRDWCVARAPAQRAVTEQGYQAWRKASGLPGIERFLLEAAPDLLARARDGVAEKRDGLYVSLDRASQVPDADCRNIQAQLNTQVNLAREYPAEYALTRELREGTGAAGGTGGAGATAVATSGSFIQGNDFTPFYKTYVLKQLTGAGGVAPFTSGGPFRPGAYRCVRDDTDEDSTLQARYRYTLNVYADSGVRLTDGTIDYRRSGTNSKMRTFEGTYRYDRVSGAISLDTDYENRDLKDVLVANGKYDSVVDRQTKYNIFKLTTDARGQPLLYAQQTYGGAEDTEQTVCRLDGPPAGLSPVETQRRRDAEADRIFNLYRTKPDQGLKLSQIEAVRHDYSTRTEGINTIGVETTYLLLKDGSVYLNLRWTPHDLDIAASRKGEPQQWTKWKTVNGRDMLLRGGQWVPFPGFRALMPGANEALTGTFENLTGYTAGLIGLGTTITTRKYISFTGQTFKQSGWSQMAGVLDTGNAVTTSSGYADDRTQQGHFTLRGLTLELRYDNGTVARTFAYWWDRKKDKLIITGTSWDRQ